MYKKAIKFHDNNNNLVIAKLEITKRNGYPEFTMCTETPNGSGQSKFIPKDGPQTKLYEIWDQYHLNGMKAGLPIQTKAILEWKKQGNKYDYKKVCDYLKSINLYEVKLKDNLPEGFFIKTYGNLAIESKIETYKYGHGWVHCNLPKDFEKTLNEVRDEIIEEEKNRFKDGIDDWGNIYDDNGNVKEKVFNLEDEKIIALGKYLGITPTEANEDIALEDDYYSESCLYSYSGILYLVCTDTEADDLWDKDLESYIDDYLEIPKEIKKYFDKEAWKEDAKIDGRGHSLGRYDGYENEEKVNGTYYYIYKQ